VSALASAPSAVRERVKLVMAGRVDADVERFLRDTCAGAGLAADLHLSTRSERGYRAIPDNLFARAIGATDVMVFPFERDHWNVQSAHFADALLAGSWILASRDTLIGDLVERHQLGRTFEYGDDASFLGALEQLLREVQAGTEPHEGRRRVVEAHGVESACRVVEDAIRGAGASARAATGSGVA
ncbi:MAG TPA: hypothetical protein VF875_10190, partial [Anaeromyxobacter sp.]